MLRKLENLKKFLKFRGYSAEAISKVMAGNFKNVTPGHKCISLKCNGEEFDPQKFDYNNSHLEGLVLMTDCLVSIRVTNSCELSTSILTPKSNTTEIVLEYLEELKDFSDLKTYLIDLYQEALFPFVYDQEIDDDAMKKWFKDNRDVEKVQLLNGNKLFVITNINNQISIADTQR